MGTAQSGRQKDTMIHKQWPFSVSVGLERVSAYKHSPGRRGRSGSWVGLIGGNVERRSAGLAGDALLQIPENTTKCFEYDCMSACIVVDPRSH